MNGMEKSLTELHGMLKTAEKNIKLSPKRDFFMMSKGKGVMKPNKGNGKAEARTTKGNGKAVVPKSGGKTKAVDPNTCLYCRWLGHWKKDCPKYQEDLKSGNVATTSGIFVIDIHLSDSASWVLGGT
ncbi:hypothetical protein vseg_015206 [Gypsophila vaccaria]